MYKKFALINGCIIAIMVFLNQQMTNITGAYINTFLYHMIAFLIVSLIRIMKKPAPILLKKLPIIFLLPGVLNVASILLNNIVVPQIGITLTVGITLFGQLIMSTLVEMFGLLGMPKNPFHKEKLVGFGIIFLGIVVMIVI